MKESAVRDARDAGLSRYWDCGAADVRAAGGRVLTGMAGDAFRPQHGGEAAVFLALRVQGGELAETGGRGKSADFSVISKDYVVPGLLVARDRAGEASAGAGGAMSNRKTSVSLPLPHHI